MIDDARLTAPRDEAEADIWVAEALCIKAEILEICDGPALHFSNIDQAFGKTFRNIKSFKLEAFDGGAFRFEAADSCFVINAVPLRLLLDRVALDAESAQAEGPGLPSEAVPMLQKKVFRVYLLHEVRHIPQGVGDYETVKAIKKIAGPEIMADLDVFADRDAAAAYAMIECQLFGMTRRNYLDQYKQALFLMGQYSFPVFRFNAGRPFKMARGVAITLMAARLVRATGDDSARHTLPLDRCVLVRVTEDYSSLLVISAGPDTEVLSAICEVPDDRLQRLVQCIEQDDFLGALDMATLLLASITALG